jgi:Caspase domain
VARSALFVSSSRYADEQLTGLPSASVDAVEMGRLFGDPALGSFSVTTLSDPRSQEMREALEDLFADAASDDIVVLYLSGHGMKDQNGNLFFAANDTRADRLQSTAVSAQFLCSVLNSSRAEGAVVFLDCCYGGAFARGMVPRASGDPDVGEAFAGLGTGARARAVITASSAIEYAFEGDRLADSRAEPSVFATAMRDGIATGDADRDGDGWVGLHELFDFVRTRIQRLGKPQTPHLWNFGASGDLRLIRSPAGPRASSRSLPAEIRELLGSPLPVVRLGAIADLEQRAGDVDLAEARAAVAALIELADDDSLRVRAAADAALSGVTLRVEPPRLVLDGPKRAARARLVGAAVARDAYPEPAPAGVSVVVDGGEVLVRADSHADAGAVEVALRWAGGTVSLPVLIKASEGEAATSGVGDVTEATTQAPVEAAATAQQVPTAPAEPPTTSSSQSTLGLPKAVSRPEGLWLVAAGVLCLVSLLVPLYPYDGANNAFYEFPSIATWAAVAGVTAIVVGGLRSAGKGGAIVIWAGVALAVLLGILAVRLVDYVRSADYSSSPASVFALLTLAAGIGFVAHLGIQLLRSRGRSTG